MRLTPTEWQVLEILARNAEHVVGRTELLRQLRGPHTDPHSHYLRVYMAQLRRKLEDDPSRPRHLYHRTRRRVPTDRCACCRGRRAL